MYIERYTRYDIGEHIHVIGDGMNTLTVEITGVQLHAKGTKVADIEVIYETDHPECETVPESHVIESLQLSTKTPVQLPYEELLDIHAQAHVPFPGK